ncbi:MAG: hypothetical protein HW403_823, partial [Dehalococcoidia bacterium]|nr:hypothetical protein [Dehalococcoidia bacterium]
MVELARLVKVEVRYTRKVANVESENGKVVVESGRSDYEIKIRNKLTTPSEQGANFGESLNNGVVNSEDVEGGKELSQACQMVP